MPSIVTGFEYDIFISYRQKDNRSGWVTEFVNALKSELDATFKEDISIYFDENPHDGLLETHDVDDSLKEKLKCLIFIPIISQTYCDPKSFAWKNEFLAFKKLASEDQLGLKVKLQNGNVASRILPVRIHELDEKDRSVLENEIGPLRSIDFIFKTPGVNRPLTSADLRSENSTKTVYKDQVNKVANAVKEIIYALQSPETVGHATSSPRKLKVRKEKYAIVISALILLISSAFIFLYQKLAAPKTQSDEITKTLDRAEQYLDEAGRFDDKRYMLNAIDATKKALVMDSTNERAMYLLAVALDNPDTSEYFHKKIISRNKNSFYGDLLKAGLLLQKKKPSQALNVLKHAELLNPTDKYILGLISFLSMTSGDYLAAWNYAKRYEKISGKDAHSLLCIIYLELGDFKAARAHLKQKQNIEEFSCDDIENYQKIFLCEGNFEKLERMTDSICAKTKCDQCPFWKLRAKMHVGKFKEASQYVISSLNKDKIITWRYPAFVLDKIGKKDSAELVSNAELKLDRERLADTSYHHPIPLYSLAAIYAMRGNYQESIRWLRKYADKGFSLGSEWYILHDPLFDEMQKNNEYFGEMMQLVQKAQAQKSAIREKIRELEANTGK